MDQAYSLYQQRLAAHYEIIKYFETKNIEQYVDLALGISRPEGNYSAAEHKIGPQVLTHNPKALVYNLAIQLGNLKDSYHVPVTIYRANIPYLRISLGSEMAMMLNPDKYWVGNVRTIYTHLVLKHNGNRSMADEELRLYREPDGSRPSQMEYRIWRDIYLSLEASLRKVARLGSDEATKQKAPSGKHVFMWADAISSCVYDNNQA
ncbi:hypothetical protein QWY84_05345 [Aquisalimonas lutea]|uniref:hypothetical protein n=1 Tax=Aquisalimonas lutea TaxID=1327750 RepID=UPI0025B5EC53|nr:hypothetical protein [Aquisalimonas lutea]MDN3517028.1 hypothetical protein [Aquisalimonas lutea]